MKKLYFLVLIYFFAATLSAQQTFTVKGTVSDEKDNSKMVGVNVSVRGTTNGVSTDSVGHYELKIPLGSATLLFSYIGYQERTEIVTSYVGNEVHTINPKMTDASKELEIVVVSGNKVEKTLGEQTQSMEVMKGQNITNSAQGLQEAMNKVPGVNMIGKTISIRGGSGFSDQTSNRTLVLLDEVPVVSPENGSVRWATLPTEAIEQMEITKGASTVLFGSQALNGSVDIKTVVPQKDSVVNKFFANYGDYFRFADHTWTWFYKKLNGVTVPPMYGSLAYLYERNFRDVDVVYNGAYQNNQGYTAFNADQIIRNYIKLRYIPHNLQSLNIGGSVNFAYQKYDDFFLYKNYNDTFPQSITGQKPTYNTQVLVPGDSNVVKTYTLNINPYITYFGKNGTRYSLRTAYYFVESNNTSGDSGRYHKLYIEPNVVRKFKKADVDLVAGLRYSYRKSESHSFGNKYAHYGAAYGQIEKRFDKRFTIRVGLSLEFNKLDTVSSRNDLNFISALAGKDSAHQYYSPVKPVVNVGVNYKLTEGTFLRGSFCQGYRFPDIAESYVLTPESGALAVPNPNLKPEYGWNAEVGIKQGMKLSRWVFYADMAAYLSRYTNLIQFVDIPSSEVSNAIKNEYPSQFIFEQAQNISHAQIWGVEVSAIGTGSIFGVPLNFLLGYNYMDPRNLDYNPNNHNAGDPNSSQYLYYRMRHSAKADIQTTYKRIIVGFTAVYIGHIQQIDPEIQQLTSIQSWMNAHGGSGDVVLDARVGYSHNRFTATLIAKNMANRAYTLRPGFVEAPASLTFQVTYQLGRIFPFVKKES
jgi:outer membrane cobalamin receptor